MSTIKLKVAKVERQTNDCKAIYFEHPVEPIQYKAGQFFTFILNIDGKEVRRSYSICTSPQTDEYMGVAVKRVEGGLVSNYLNDNVKAGDELELLSPLGNFTYTAEENKSTELLLIGGGSGITPMMSILKTALSETENVNIKLLYVNRSKEDIIFKETINTLERSFSERLQVVHYLDDDNKGVSVTKKKGISGLFGGKKKAEDPGFITLDKARNILESMNPSSEAAVYICGPTGLMDLMDSALIAVGIDKDRVKKESFVAAQAIVDESAPVVKSSGEERIVKAIISGVEHKFPVKAGVSILQAGLAANVEMPFSCQGGICTACMGTCKSGTVSMENTDSLTPKELEQGFVLTCVGHAESDDIVIEF